MHEKNLMKSYSIRLPKWVTDYFKEKSNETTIGKTTLLRSFLLKAIREKEGSLSEIRNWEKEKKGAGNSD